MQRWNNSLSENCKMEAICYRSTLCSDAVCCCYCFHTEPWRVVPIFPTGLDWTCQVVSKWLARDWWSWLRSVQTCSISSSTTVTTSLMDPLQRPQVAVETCSAVTGCAAAVASEWSSSIQVCFTWKSVPWMPGRPVECSGTMSICLYNVVVVDMAGGKVSLRREPRPWHKDLLSACPLNNHATFPGCLQAFSVVHIILYTNNTIWDGVGTVGHMKILVL